MAVVLSADLSAAIVAHVLTATHTHHSFGCCQGVGGVVGGRVVGRGRQSTGGVLKHRRCFLEAVVNATMPAVFDAVRHSLPSFSFHHMRCQYMSRCGGLCVGVEVGIARALSKLSPADAFSACHWPLCCTLLCWTGSMHTCISR